MTKSRAGSAPRAADAQSNLEESDAEANEVTALIPGKARASIGKLHHGDLGVIGDMFGLNVLVREFGHKLLIMLFASQHLMKGFTTAFTGPAVQYIYASYKVKGPQMQIFGGVTMLPWAMKPIIGLLSDAFPIRGLHKAPYILIASVFGACACATIGVSPQSHLSIEHLVICLFLMQFQFSTCDLLTEAKYAEKMQSKPEHGPSLMTFVWFGLQAAGLVATGCVGPVMKHFGPRMVYLVALVPASFIIIPVAKNYLEETPKSSIEVSRDRQHLFAQKEACILCFLMFIGTVVLSVLGIVYESTRINAAAAIIVAVVMLTAFSILLKPVIAKVNAFFLVQTSLGVSIGGAAFYFYVDTPEQYPEGPHFSMEFFTSALGIVGSIFSLVGIYTYQRYASKWSYRGLLIMTNLVAAALSMLDVMMFKRLNVRMGIPDNFFVMGSSVFQTIIGQWMWMPGVVILSQLCPKGMEATMYALLAGCHNLGNTIASNTGALLLELLDCQPNGVKGESAQFRHLWVASLLSTVLPTLTVALIPWLIPNARQTDKLMDENDRDATAGSLWRRWTGQD